MAAVLQVSKYPGRHGLRGLLVHRCRVARAAARPVLGRCVLDEWLACFRGADGKPVVLRDRCLHRSGRFSAGTASAGRLICPYHGWKYDAGGTSVAVPSTPTPPQLCNPPYPCWSRRLCLRRLNRDAPRRHPPFSMPHTGEPGWRHLRLQNRFANTVANCVENFIDIPHTAFVQPASSAAAAASRSAASVARENGAVHVRYRNERANLGSFGWFLNPGGGRSYTLTASMYPT